MTNVISTYWLSSTMMWKKTNLLCQEEIALPLRRWKGTFVCIRYCEIYWIVLWIVPLSTLFSEFTPCLPTWRNLSEKRNLAPMIHYSFKQTLIWKTLTNWSFGMLHIFFEFLDEVCWAKKRLRWQIRLFYPKTFDSFKKSWAYWHTLV